MSRILIIIFFLLITSGISKEYYENCIPGAPIPFTNKSIGGVYKKVTPKCSHKLSPIDLTKEQMQTEAYDRISKGISVFLIAFIISIAFANPLTHKIADISMGIGGIAFVTGIVKLFVATYLTWIIVGVIILLLIAIVYRLRGRSILRSVEWIKNLNRR